MNLLPGWDCPHCKCFNGDVKQRLEECRACGTKRPKVSEEQSGNWLVDGVKTLFLYIDRSVTALEELAKAEKQKAQSLEKIKDELERFVDFRRDEMESKMSHSPDRG